MPSGNFRKMAQSQLELLANSLTRIDNPSASKVQSMILYLPQENSYSGQLEFTPAVLYPDPSTERIFIASDAASGQAPTLPKSLSKLPGFSSAPDLLPGYPMLAHATDPGVGMVEEVMCDIRFRTSALSVPLLSGSQTVGVLLVSPTVPVNTKTKNNNHTHDGIDDDLWTKRDKEQVSLAAQSLSMALGMDNERNVLREQNTIFRENLSDSLHQMKNPIQALRTYGKILQRQIVETSMHNSNNTAVTADLGGTAQLLELAERLMVQSDRVVDMLGPMDSLVETLDQPNSNSLVMLPPAVTNDSAKSDRSMVLWNDQHASANRTDERIDGRQNSGPRRDKSMMMIQEASDPRALHFNSTIDEDNFQPLIESANTNNHERRHRDSQQQQSEGTGLPATVIGDFETEMVFITDVLNSVLDTFGAIASEQGVSFEVLIEDEDDLPGVFVAPKSFQEATSNVLDNALKYCVLPKAGSPFTINPDPRVRVRIYPNDNIENAGVTVLVEDNGPGVAEEDRDRVFDRGFRSDRTSSEVVGRGIGLDISRALMARMGGYLGLAGGDGDDDSSQFSDRLDGAAMKLEVTRKSYKAPGR
eukprot:CAMPEP_0201122970 /NCGR_PEP_ID=MMETSP0850-20130426/6468_1 /ASSEMBLY_ACC=CAM_ASM_000622 /TAXON_ID=183588 /ORGANISM="Pseudo-nitzschia fraudulenta, Strain WWA7" /LENGTH=587 /DNA_ID=CAMNT_0047389767 /DNA_START=203 /DNA_END=1966 /DNA_ORIENTATION=+